MTKAKTKRTAKRTSRRLHGVVGEPTAIFSGKSSVGMWKDINESKTIDDLRMALYVVACRCQELESEVRRLSNAPAHRPEAEQC